MKQLKPYLFAFLIGALTLSSCKKDQEDDQNGTPLQNPFSNSITTVLAQEAPTPETFIIPSQISSSIKTEKYGRYNFPPNAFADLNGNTVTGAIQISVTEYFDNSDLFYAGLSTRSDDNWLITGGQFLIEASQNGQPLQIADGKSYQAFVPNNNGDSNMDVFLGEELPDGSVNWLPSVDGQETVSPISVQEDSVSCAFAFYTLELEAGQVATFSYSAGNEDPSFHSITVEFMNGTENSFSIDPNNPQVETITATQDAMALISLSDFNWDGWQGASLEITIDGEPFSITIDSDDCDPVPFSWFYQVDLVTLGWVNCDYFAGDNPNSVLTITSDEEYDCSNMLVYTVFNDEDVVGATFCNEDGEFTSYMVPENTSITICALALIDDIYYSAFVEVAVTGDMTENITLEETSLEDFENTLNNL